MGIADRLRKLTKKAEEAAVEHQDQIHDAVQKAEAAADQRTGGQYHDQIVKAGDRADAYVEHLKPAEPTDHPEPDNDRSAA
jgi:antitoxin protein of toxin-antitoxin system